MQESLREYAVYEMQVTKHMYNMISILLRKKLKDEKKRKFTTILTAYF